MRAQVAGLIAAAVGLQACTHAFIYDRDAPPQIADGELVVPKESGDDRMSIRRIGVATIDQPFSFRPATNEELAELRQGAVPEWVATMRVEVDATGTFLRDWGLAGFGVGASTVLTIFALSGAITPGGDDFAITVPLTMLFAAVAGAEFMLIGMGLGAAFEGHDTDMRFRTYADE